VQHLPPHGTVIAGAEVVVDFVAPLLPKEAMAATTRVKTNRTLEPEKDNISKSVKSNKRRRDLVSANNKTKKNSHHSKAANASPAAAVLHVWK
jgi:hypothetical protein